MSIALIKTLEGQRHSTWEQAKGLLDKAAAEQRDLTAEEQASFEKMNGDLDSMRQRIDQLVEFDQANKDAEESLRRLGVGDTGGSGEQSIGDQLRKLGLGEIRSVDLSPVKFGEAASRALSVGSSTAGGATVPTSFYNRLVEHMVETSGLLQLGPEVINTTGGETIPVPVTTSHGASAGLTAEAATIGGTDPAFAQRSLGAYKYPQLIKVSTELVTDSAFDIEGYLARAAGRNVGLSLGAHLITGTGSSQPTGVVTSASTGVTGGTGVSGAFTADNLIDLFYSVIAPYRNSPSAGWLMKDATMGAVRKLKDSAGAYIFAPGLGMGAPDTILGKPVQTDPNVAAVALSAKSVVFGDFSAYFVRFAGGVRFEKSTDFAFDTDQVAYRAIIRADGITADQTGAIKVFAGAGT